MAVLKRVKTRWTRKRVLNPADYEFDSGISGLRQRLRLARNNLWAHVWNEVLSFFHSFVGLHYIYVVSSALVLSWILYPQKNMTYTDSLFQAVSAVTLTGLNTVNLNELKLYQQIFLFVIPCALHPLTIAQFMVYYRLHLYRREFAHIEQTSKQQSKLRRAMTRQHTRGSPPRVSLQLPQPGNEALNDEPSVHSSVSTPGSSSESVDSNEVAVEDYDADTDAPNRIKFGALPRPGRDPSEMFRSLQQMRQQNLREDMDEDDGPALVIKSPRDIELDELRGIHSAVAEPGRRNSTFSNYGHPFRRLSTDGGRAGVLRRSETGLSTASSRKAKQMRSNYLSWTPTVGRNSAFFGLSRDQIEELGGVEYRALKLLRWLAFGYYLVSIVLGWLFVLPWVYERKYYRQIIEKYGVSPVTFGMTVVLSAFNNSGYCTIPTSIAEFWQTAYLPLVLSMLIMGGNVALPIMLRFTVWVLFNLSPKYGQTRETLGFLLDHPRRCFMLLFPATTTWWLAITIVIFMVIEVSLFMILDSGSHSPQPDMSAGPRLLSAYFQSVSVRTVGFTIINVASQAPGMLVLNVIMIYVAIYPVAMSIRKSNVYEEQALGRMSRGGPASLRTASVHTPSVYTPSVRAPSVRSPSFSAPDTPTGPRKPPRALSRTLTSKLGFTHNNNSDELLEKEDDDVVSDEEEEENPGTLVDHMRRQLSVDIWSFVVGVLLISISEGGSISKGKYSLFQVVYEVLSAHCTVGLSIGYGDTNLSTSGGFSNVGKLVLMAVMIRGRHRGMPYEIDRAIMLNSQDVEKRDRNQQDWVRDPRVMSYSEPQESWLPRVATTASRLAPFGTISRRSHSMNERHQEPHSEA